MFRLPGPQKYMHSSVSENEVLSSANTIPLALNASALVILFEGVEYISDMSPECSLSEET